MNVKLEFPCPYKNYYKVDTCICAMCIYKDKCDIYSTMLNEEQDIKKEEGK